MSGAQIHPTAIVGAGAELAADISIDAYTIIGSRVRLGVGTIVGPHVVIEGNTTIGARNRIFQFASIGAEPQDLKYHGEDSALIIGDDNRIREFCTLQPGTEGGGMLTRVGSGNLLMNYSHIAHDCLLGDRIVIANGVQLGGQLPTCAVAKLDGRQSSTTLPDHQLFGVHKLAYELIQGLSRRLTLRRVAFPVGNEITKVKR